MYVYPRPGAVGLTTGSTSSVMFWFVVAAAAGWFVYKRGREDGRAEQRIADAILVGKLFGDADE